MGRDELTVRAAQRAARTRPYPPSELTHRPLLKWPTEVEALAGIPEGLLRARQAAGDAPRLVRIGRQVFIRPRDLHDWIDRHVEGQP